MMISSFGPKIYKTKLDTIVCQELEQIILANENNIELRANKHLAGYIEKEIDILQHIQPSVLPKLTDLVFEYLNLLETGIKVYKPFHRRDIKCTASWANIQTENEYNPIHNHPTSDVVCVTFPVVDIKSKCKYLTNSNSKPGSLFFYYGDGDSLFHSNMYEVVPESGDVYIFSGSLNHSTTPIFDNDIRISTSTNFSFTEYFRIKQN